MKSGLLMLYVGSRSGTAAMALGQTMRAIGRRFRICYIQFCQNTSLSETFRVNRYKELLEFHPFQKTLTDFDPERENGESLARSWNMAQKAIVSGEFRIMVLEGMAEVLESGVLNGESIVHFLTGGSTDTDIIVTGRNAPPYLMDAADLVTEVRETCNNPTDVPVLDGSVGRE